MRLADVVVVAALTLTATPSLAQNWTTWQDFAVMNADGGNASVVLQWRAQDSNRGSNTRVQWRVVNNTGSTLYDVGIDNKTYICDNGRSVGRSGERVAGRIEPNAMDSTLPDNLDGNTCPGVSSAEFASAQSVVSFSVERGGRRQGWGNFGNVSGR